MYMVENAADRARAPGVVILGLVLVGLALPSAAARALPPDTCLTPLIENEPLCNPALAPSEWPITHRGDYAQGSSAFPGPVPGQAVQAAHIDLPGPPITLALGPEYEDGGHAIWGSVLGPSNAVVKIDSQTFALIDSYVPADEEDTPPGIPLGVSGAYSVVDPDFNFLLGRADFVEVFGDSTPGDRSSEIALVKRVFLPSTAFCRDSDLVVGGVVLPDRTLALISEQAVVSVIPAEVALMEAAAVQSLPSENGADCADTAIPDEDLETVSNSLASDENGGIYAVSDAAVIKYQWDGTSLAKVWRTEYESDPPFSLLRLGPGSGSTPSLMGTALDDDRFVVITDGRELMHLVLMWREDIPVGWQPIAPGKDPRIACEVPITFGDPAAVRTLSEQSVLVRGYSAVVVNNLLSSEEGITRTGIGPLDTAIAALMGGDATIAPRGIERVDWDPVAQTCDTVWTNAEISLPNAIPTMSAATGLMHAIGQRGGVWGLETLDFDTGRSTMFNPSSQVECSQAVLDEIDASIFGALLAPVLTALPRSCENSFFAATEVGPDGMIYTGTFQGVSRFVPDSVVAVSLKRKAANGAEQGEDLANRGIAALPADVETARDAAARGQTQLTAALAAVAAGAGTDLDSSSATNAAALLTAARGHLVSAEAALVTDVGLADAEFRQALVDLAEASDWLLPCPPAPQADCRVAAKAAFTVKLDGARSRLRWKWKSSTPAAGLPDPTDRAEYALCAYDGGGGNRIAQVIIPSSSVAWKAIRGGFRYTNKALLGSGIRVARLKEKRRGGVARVVGKGANVPGVALPVTAPLTVQLVNSETGLCWGAVFDSGDFKKNETGSLKASFKN